MSYVWTTPNVAFTSGETLSHSDMNATNNNIGVLASRAGNPCARMTQTAQQSVASGSVQIVNFAADFLLGGFTFASNQLTAPVTGYYLINCYLVYTSAVYTGADYMETQLIVGGATVKNWLLGVPSADQTVYWGVGGGIVVPVTAGNNINVWAGNHVAATTRVSTAQASYLDATLVSA